MPVSANSMPAYWEAVTLEGAFFSDEDCPIEVKNEKLTFEITDFLKEDYYSVNSFQEYESNMSAEYTFYNPTENDITAKLFFPMGNLPENTIDIAQDDNVWPYDLDKYDVLVNGQGIEKQVCHLYVGEGAVFDAKTALEGIKDSYQENEFYSPEMPVTKYTYKVEGLDEDGPRYLSVIFEIPEYNENTRYIFPYMSSVKEEGRRYVGDTVFADEVYEIYVVGNDEAPVLDCEIYEHEGPKLPEVKFVIDSTEKMTFAEYVQSQNDERYRVSEVDWYNVAVTCLERNTKAKNLVNGWELSEEYLYTKLMRWYEYEITVPAKGTIVNTVKAPIYPAYDAEEAPNRYKYIYYLSPAKEWKKFGNLTIEIHTPYHLNSTNLGEFEETEDGYKLEMDGLPDSEFEFVMSRTDDPDNERQPFEIGEFLFWATEYIAIFTFVIPLIPGIVIVVIVLIFYKKRRKKEE